MTSLFRLLHIASAILFIGELCLAAIWLRASVARGENLRVARYVVATMRLTSRGLAFPAIVVQLVSGIALIHFARVPWSRAVWLWVAIGLFTVVASLWHGTLIPLRKRMEQALEGAAGGADIPAEYGPLAVRWISVCGTILALLAAILVLMIWRPVLP